MDTSVTVTLVFTTDDSLRVAQYLRHRSFLYRYDAILTAALIFVVIVTATLLMANDLREINVFGAAIFGAIPAFFCGIAVFGVHKFVSPWLMNRKVVKYFKESPTTGEEIALTFSDVGMHFESETTSSRSKWSVVNNVEETESDILFYCGKSLVCILPKRSLESPELLKKLRLVIKNAVGDKAHLF